MKIVTQLILFAALIGAPALMLEAKPAKNNVVAVNQEYVLKTGTKLENATVQFPCEPVSRYDADMGCNLYGSAHYNVIYSVAILPLSSIEDILDLEPETLPKTSDADYKEAVLLALFEDDTDFIIYGFDTLRYKEFVDHHGYLALEWVVDTEEGDVEKTRVVITENNVYQLSIQCDKGMESRGDFFFDTLKIQSN